MCVCVCIQMLHARLISIAILGINEISVSFLSYLYDNTELVNFITIEYDCER